MIPIPLTDMLPTSTFINITKISLSHHYRENLMFRSFSHLNCVPDSQPFETASVDAVFEPVEQSRDPLFGSLQNRNL